MSYEDDIVNDDLREFTSHANQVIRQMLNDMAEADYEAAQEDPKRHKLTKIMERGKDPNYRSYTAGKNGRGQQVNYCYTVHRNAAGYFLVFRQVRGKKKIVNDQWDACKTKQAAKNWAYQKSEEFRAK